MNNLERQLLITSKMYEEKLVMKLTKPEYDELQIKVFRYLMINDLVTLPWNNPLSQIIKKQYHITENDVKEFYNKFWRLKQEDDHGKPACDLQFEEPEEEETEEEEPEETENILNDCAGCVFYNPDDDCCENNARICTYKEED